MAKVDLNKMADVGLAMSSNPHLSYNTSTTKIDVDRIVTPLSPVAPYSQSDYYTDSEFDNIDATLTAKYNSLVDEISKYSMLTESLSDLHDETRRINLFAKLSYGLRKSGEAKAWVSFHLNIAESDAKAAQGIAALDDFPEYVIQQQKFDKQIKTTEGVLKAFVMQSSRVLIAHRKVAMLQAMDEVISIYKSQFSMAISTVKAIVYGNRDSLSMSGFDNVNKL